MAKIYSGGIEIATGFKQLSPVPIDDRCAVKLDLDLDLLENKCKGLMSYSDESKTVFFYDGNEWIPFLKEGSISNLTDNVIPKKSPSGNTLEDSNIQDTAVGIEVFGRVDSTTTVERRVATTASSSFTIDLNNPSGHYDLTLTENTNINFSNMITVNQSTVITLVVGGNYSLLFPGWLKPMNNNDDYYASKASDVNLITILIRNGGGSPQGMYSLTNVDLA